MNNQESILSLKTIDIINNHRSNFLIKIAFSFAFTVTMAISANVFLYIPVTPIPITLQTLTVLLSGIFLGSKIASLCQIQYLLLGIAGFPVFAGFKNGVNTILGPTGGYIIGFIFAAYITGYIFENFNNYIKNKIYLSLMACLSGLLIIYLSGFVHLFIYLYFMTGGQDLKFIALKTFNLAVKPFILIEFIKLFIIIDLASVLNIKH